MQAADFMQDVAGSDHAVLVLKDWRNRTQEDLLAEVADDLGFGIVDGDEVVSFDGFNEVRAHEAEGFFKRLGVDLDVDMVTVSEDWKDHSRDEMIAKFAKELDSRIRAEQNDPDHDDEALLEANIAQALYDSIDAQIEDLLARSQKLRERAEEMMSKVAQREARKIVRTGTEDPSKTFEATGSFRFPSYATLEDFEIALNRLWERE